MRRFRIDLNEWYKKDKNDGTDIGRTIGELTFEQKEGEQNTIRDLKNWLLLKGLEDNNDFCPCFLKIYKYSHYNNSKGLDIITKCVEYNDNTLLDSTIFNENNTMYVSFDKSRKCTCGKIQELKGVKNIFDKRLEQEKKNLQNDFDKKASESEKKYEEKLNRVTNKLKDQIQQEKQEKQEL